MWEEKLIYPGGSSQGRAGGLGPACTALVAGDETILFDSGMEILEARKSGFPDLDTLKGRQVSTMVISHSHLDHVGGLHRLEEKNVFKEGTEIFVSPQTREITKRIMYQNWREGICASFGDYVRISSRFKKIPLGEFEILPNVMAFCGAAGHLPGALYLIVKLPSGLKVLFCGDLSWQEQEIVGGTSLPDDIPDEWLPDIIAVTDLTNPEIVPFDRELTIGQIVERAKKGISEGRKIIFGTFANGKEQLLALALVKAGIRPVYADGSGVEYFRIYNENRWSPKDKIFSLEGIEFINGNDGRRKAILESPGPCVIVTPAGMGDGGPIRFYLQRGLSDEKFDFIATSYLAPGCTLDRLLKKSRERDQNGRATFILDNDGQKEVYQLNCSTGHFRLSGHSGLGETAEMMKKITDRRAKVLGEDNRKMKVVVLTHGTDEGKKIAASVLSDFAESVLCGQIGTVIDLKYFSPGCTKSGELEKEALC